MTIDRERISRYLIEIKNKAGEIEEVLNKNTDKEILENKWLIRGLKYLLIEIAEAIANVLTHILVKDKGIIVSGYVDTVTKAKENSIISGILFNKIRPFMDFRNSLIHRYWIISDEKLVKLTRENYKDFEKFIEEIEKYLKEK